MLIFAKEAAQLLGRKNMGRNDFAALGIECQDGPVVQGGNNLILVDRDKVLAVAVALKSQKVEKQYNNKEALARARFQPTAEAMDLLRKQNEKLDRLIAHLEAR